MSLKKFDLNREEIQPTCKNASAILLEEKLILLTGNNQKSKQEKAMKEGTLKGNSGGIPWWSSG